MKPRHHLYLDDELTTELELLASKPGASKSSIVADALRQYLRHRGGNPHEVAIARRLDKLSQQNAKMQRDMDVLFEALTRFIRTYMLMTGNLPSPDDAARTRANVRYNQFIDAMGKALATQDAPGPRIKSNALETASGDGDGQ
jgi:Arc/MetJ family transcription regulator